jgi:NADH dehydrogenase [ubiquinone] 1 alpha subcomplex assembly factor 1
MTAIHALVVLWWLAAQVVASEVAQPLLDFSASDAPQAWQAVNDGVMGGVSDGRFRMTDDHLLEFSGTLSLENNGGFASIRTKPTDINLKAGDTLVVRVKGDGREYILNIYTKSRRMAFSYRAALPTTKDEWRTIEVPLSDFIPTSFGRRVGGMGPVDPSQINGLGVMLSDKKPGKFQLQIESITVRRGAD